MNILAEHYRAKKFGDKIIVYNSIYEDSTFPVYMVAGFDLMLPNTNGCYIPLAIELEMNHDDVTIDKYLKVTGTKDYNYFIPEAHYSKWKRTYRRAFFSQILSGFLACVFLVYLFAILSIIRPIIAVLILINLIITIRLIITFYRQIILLRKYDRRELLM